MSNHVSCQTGLPGQDVVLLESTRDSDTVEKRRDVRETENRLSSVTHHIVVSFNEGFSV